MKIELKNIYHSAQLSEETEAFTANLYVNGTHAGYVKNDGHGGSTDYNHKDAKGRELIHQAEAFCKALPAKVYPAERGMKAFSLDMNLEHYIDDLLADHLQKKELTRFNKKMEKAMEKGIVFGIAGDSFTTITFTVPISKVLEHPKGPEIIAKTITEKILPKLGDGKVLNDNIPENILKQAGLTEGQYTKPINQANDISIDRGLSSRSR
jgi:hypothetical protein